MSWKTVKLGDAASIERRSVQPCNIKSGSIYVGLENIKSGGGFTNVKTVEQDDLASSKFMFSNEHVLFGKLRPYLAKIATPSFQGICSTDILPILPSNELDKNYLAYFLLQPKIVQLANSLCTGANLPRISPNALVELQIPLPPLAEQKRIAAILDKADEIRRKREQTIAKLDQLAQSIFVEMFGNAAINDKGWDLGKIGDLLESATYGTSEKSNAIGSYAVLRMNNITKNGAIDMTDLKYMDLEEKHLDRFLVQAGDVLFNRTNSADLVGKTAIYRSNTPVAYAGYLIRLRVNHKANAEYLASYLNTKYAKKELRSMCKSIIGMANINAKEIQAMRIPIPPLALQDQFAYRIKEIEALKIPNIAALTQQTQLFASLQHQAFTGNL
jgi:type I restriction enzyme S subunit